MDISIMAILGVLCAIVIVYILIRTALAVLAWAGVPIDPIWYTIAYAALTILAIFAVAWAFGIPIPFVHLR